MARDPLCPDEQHGDATGVWPFICPWCLALRTARLQGPVSDHGHVLGCWCQACYPSGYEQEGKPL